MDEEKNGVSLCRVIAYPVFTKIGEDNFAHNQRKEFFSANGNIKKK